MGPKKNNKPANAKAKPAKAENDSKQPWWFNQPLPIDRFTGWLVAWTFLLFLATTGLGIAAFFQWRALESTDHHIADQLSIMRAGQRAWVTIESVEIGDPLIFVGDGAGTGFKIGLRNVGSLPAARVWAIIHLYPDKLFKNYPPECNMTTRKQFIGINLLPNELNNRMTWHADSEAGGESTAIPQKLDFGLFVVGCILYASFGDTTVHSTGFAGTLFRKDKTEFNMDKIRYEAGELFFSFMQGFGVDIR